MKKIFLCRKPPLTTKNTYRDELAFSIWRFLGYLEHPNAGAIIAGYKANAQASDEIQNAGGGDEEDGECMDLSRGGAENQPENTDNKTADNNNNDDHNDHEENFQHLLRQHNFRVSGYN